ncbi:MAG: relaxase [Clostridiales bacterium]|nr:relaxase [Clostridiales bacterium]
MAVTRIWSIKGRAGAPLSYIANPEKTQREFTEPEMQALADVIAYATNEGKTERHYYTTGINCSVECARDQFDTTKLRFGKTGGNVAYHAYQSFKPGEVTPEEAHAIGVELAQELWGDRFQVVVATHLDRDHLHNHLVINSVSFRDGLKFHECRDNTRLLRDTSDRICLEHGLSVIEKPKGKRVNSYVYKMEHAGMPTRYNVARQAIDESIALSLTIEEFKSELRKRGYNYRFDPQRKYWTVTPPGWKKAIRIHQLGEDYTRESIERRIYENDPSVRTERLRQTYRRTNHYSLRRRIDHIMGRSGLEKLYLRYCYELGYLPKYKQNPTRLHIVLKDDLLKCDQYSEQAKLLCKYHVDTDEDLLALMEKLEAQAVSLTADRSEQKKITRRVLPEVEIEKARAEMKELTAEIRELRHELKVCRDIQERSGHVRENLEIVDRDRAKERTQERS